MVIEVVANNAPAVLKLDPDEPWEQVAVATIAQLTAGLSDALGNVDDHQSVKGALKAFSDGQLLELGRVVLAQVARTPGMLGVQRTEVQAIIAGMADAMDADDNLLLSPEEWITIAGAAARMAAANPGRLFGLSAADHGDAVAVMVITTMLETAAASWTTDGRDARPLLFGETLKAAVEAAVASLAGNISAASHTPDRVGDFLQQLLQKAAEQPEKFGSGSLLKVFQAFIGTVLAEGRLPDDQEIDDILSS